MTATAAKRQYAAGVLELPDNTRNSSGRKTTLRPLDIEPGATEPVPAHSHVDSHFFMMRAGPLAVDAAAERCYSHCAPRGILGFATAAKAYYGFDLSGVVRGGRPGDQIALNVMGRERGIST